MAAVTGSGLSTMPTATSAVRIALRQGRARGRRPPPRLHTGTTASGRYGHTSCYRLSGVTAQPEAPDVAAKILGAARRPCSPASEKSNWQRRRFRARELVALRRSARLLSAGKSIQRCIAGEADADTAAISFDALGDTLGQHRNTSVGKSTSAELLPQLRRLFLEVM